MAVLIPVFISLIICFNREILYKSILLNFTSIKNCCNIHVLNFI